MKLAVMDGNSILNRAFYAIRPLTTREGLYTHAIHGFLTTLLRVRREENPDGLCVTFDVHAPTFRHKADPSYKSTRRPMPDELRVQIPALKETLDALGIRRYELPGWEADDLLGTIARKSESAGWECVIVTGDRDALQLITAHTGVKLITNRAQQETDPVITPQKFREQYGFDPIHLIDLKALMGDASDHISGVTGIGEKTAMSLIRMYGSIDEIYRRLPELDAKPGIIRKLTEGESQARHSYWLATIVTDAPLDFHPDEQLWREPDSAAYFQFQKLELYKLIDRFGLRPSSRTAQSSSRTGQTASQTDLSHTPQILSRDLRTRPFTGAERVEILRDGEAVTQTVRLLSGTGESISIRAGEGLNPFVIYAVKGRTAYVLDAAAFHGNMTSGNGNIASQNGDTASENGDTASENGNILSAIRALLNTDASKIGHNIKDLQRELLARGMETDRWTFDTALAAYLLDATAGHYELERLCIRYLGFSPEWDAASGAAEQIQLSLLNDENPSDDTHKNTPEDIPATNPRKQEITVLAAQAAAVAWLYDTLEPELVKQNLLELYRTAELPLCAMLAEMEGIGCLVDKAALTAFGNTLSERIREREKTIEQLAGTSFNLNSPKQLGEILFDRLGLPHGKKTKTGWSTNADTLEKLRDVPIVREILDYRQDTKLKSTYADGLLKAIAPDGRVHTSFQMTATATGRLSSTEPNLQNIPVRTDLGSEIRRMFIPAEGNVLVDADYSQIELRLLAHISGDETLKQAFASGQDIHTAAASQVFRVPPEDVTAQMRRSAKAVNFGIVYGISAFSLAQDIHVSVADAKAYMDAWFATFPGVRKYMDTVVEQAKKSGYVETLFHRRRNVPELKSSNYNTRSFGERVALNMPVQGTAADIMKLAMLAVRKRLNREHLQARAVLQIHDELIVECPEGEAEHAAEILRDEMEHAASLSIPLTVETHWGKNWFAAKG